MSSSTTRRPRGLPLVGSIVHPTDFSPTSKRAFAHALAIALLRQTELTIVHVTDGPADDADWSRFPPVRETLERWGMLKPDSPRSALFDELKLRVRKLVIQSGHPVLATADYLANAAVDLVVLATDGRAGVPRWTHRSSAEAIARWSATMSLFIPAGAQRDLITLETGELHLERILVPIDSARLQLATPDASRRTGRRHSG